MAARFLVSRLSSLGDVVCTTPVASALKAGHPGCEVVWVVDPRFAGVVECCSAVDTVIRAKPKFVPSSWPTVEGEFDASLDMQGLFKSAIVVGRSRAKTKLGYHWRREGAWLFSDRVIPDPTSEHIVDQYVDVARAAGGIADRAEFAMVPNEDDLEKMSDLLKAEGIGRSFVIVNPGAAWATKRWPTENFAALIDGLAHQGVQSALIGTKGTTDMEVAQAVIDACRSKPANLLGATNVRELVALISFCQAHIGGDTGSTHIAAALGVPAIGLYSITRPQRSCPYGQFDRCHYDPDSLSNIQANAVLESVTEALH